MKPISYVMKSKTGEIINIAQVSSVDGVSYMVYKHIYKLYAI